MRELTVLEMQEVAGADFFSRIGAGVVGALAGAGAGIINGGLGGGSTGGLLGAGIIAAGIGAIAGGITGAILGGLYGLINDWDPTVTVFNRWAENQWDHPQTL